MIVNYGNCLSDNKPMGDRFKQQQKNISLYGSGLSTDTFISLFL